MESMGQGGPRCHVVSVISTRLTLVIRMWGSSVRSAMHAASQLPGRSPLMWMILLLILLHLHVNLNDDYDELSVKLNYNRHVTASSRFNQEDMTHII